MELDIGVSEAGLKCNGKCSKLNVKMLVDTIHNLSELFIFQCSNGASRLSKVDNESLKLAVKNLDACVYKETAPNSTQEPNLQNAIKDVLVENFSAKEEMHSETVLFKNLWLEAEAASFSSTIRDRYERIKTEMDIDESPKTRAEPQKTFEKIHGDATEPSSSDIGEQADEEAVSLSGEDEITKLREKLLMAFCPENYQMINLTPKVSSPDDSLISTTTGKTSNNGEPSSVMTRSQILKHTQKFEGPMIESPFEFDMYDRIYLPERPFR